MNERNVIMQHIHLYSANMFNMYMVGKSKLRQKALCEGVGWGGGRPDILLYKYHKKAVCFIKK